MAPANAAYEEGGNRDPEVFTDLHEESEARVVTRLEEQSLTEGNVVLSTQRNGCPRGGGGGSKLSQLVKFAIVGGVRFRYNPENLPPIQHDRAVEQEMLDLERYADHRDQVQVHRSRKHALQRVERAVQQSLLMEQILARIGG